VIIPSSDLYESPLVKPLADRTKEGVRWGVREWSQRMRDMGRLIDTIVSQYWPDRTNQPIGREESHAAAARPSGVIPLTGIVSMAQVIRLLEVEWGSLLAALIQSEVGRMQEVKKNLAARGVKYLFQTIGLLAGEKTKGSAEILRIWNMNSDTEFFERMEKDFRIRCAEAREWMLQEQLGREDDGDVEPGATKTQVRKCYSRRPEPKKGWAGQFGQPQFTNPRSRKP